MTKNYCPPLVPGCYYHIFNRGNNQENIFCKPENYLYFLKKYSKYLSDWLDTYVYCLLPNHFHLLVRVKDEKDLPVFGGKNFPGENFPGLEDLESLGLAEGKVRTPSEMISEQFRLFFMAYSKAINKQEGRTGSLFQKNFKRLEVNGDGHFTYLIFYIHANAQLHAICDDFKDYPFSSYSSILSKQPTKLCRQAVLEWFGSAASFEEFHAQRIELKMIEMLMIED